jgi:two-component system, chemotaxis family, protein-glutamate methylesterase/glutaminase
MNAPGPFGRTIDIICIGASAGGVGGLQQLIGRLPAGFPASVFIVLHLPQTGTSVLPSILNRAGKLPVLHAVNNDPIVPAHVYVAPPGFHLTLERHGMRVTRGARENGSRPAIDPLFRSAALAFGPRVAGVVLSGLLDDGTVGLREIKRAGGLAIVQDPADTPWPSMPQHALDHVPIDHCASPAAIGDFLVSLVGAERVAPAGLSDTERAVREVRVLTMHEDERDKPGDPSPYSCPECGGVLWELRDGEMLRFRCRVGHAYTSDLLLTDQGDTIERALWTALRALEEQGALKRRLAERARTQGNATTASHLDHRARDLHDQAEQVRSLLLAGVGAARKET